MLASLLYLCRWAHVDAGAMNAEDSEQKKAAGAAAATVQQDTALAPKKGLDFGSMFAERAQEQPGDNSELVPWSCTSDTDEPCSLAGCSCVCLHVEQVTSVSVVLPLPVMCCRCPCPSDSHLPCR
jgi:hypothetical protein